MKIFNTSMDRVLACVLVCSLQAALLMLSGCAMAQPSSDPRNIVVVMIDRSLSFEARQQSAIDSTLHYLDQIANRKVGRWVGKDDKIVVISLDAIPVVLWQGNLQELKARTGDDWRKQFAARRDYQKCTDVKGAFSLAAKEFAGADGESTYKYLLVFSDLIDEPPTTSAFTCAKPHYGPSNEFPWASLRNVSVNVFWLPIDQKLIWQRAVEKHGLADYFALYSDSESGAVQIAAPPVARFKVSKSEQAEEANHYLMLLKRGLWIIGLLAAALAVGFLVALLSARRRRSLPKVRARAQRQILTPEQLRARNAGRVRRSN